MKTFLNYCITITFLLITACTENVNIESEQKALLDADKAWADAAASGDVEKIKTFWSEDAINYYPGQEPAFGKQEILEIVKRNRSIPGFNLSWEPRNAVVSKSGDLGYTHGSYKILFNDPEGNTLTRAGNYVCIWKKQEDGSWKCVMESSVPGPQPKN